MALVYHFPRAVVYPCAALNFESEVSQAIVAMMDEGSRHTLTLTRSLRIHRSFFPTEQGTKGPINRKDQAMSVSLTDLMKELQAGEEARAKVPQLIAANDDLAKRLDNAQFHNGTLEGNIIGYKQQIDALSAKVRSLEVERDDAGFRELEAADKLNTLLQFVRGVAHDVDNTVRQIDPPKPEPTAQPAVQDAPMPMTEPKADATNVPITDHSAGPGFEASSTSIPSSSGQSDPLPSAPSTVPILSAASGTDAGPSAPVASTTDLPYRPFEGDVAGPKPTDTIDFPEEKRWYNKPVGMSSADWIASGGQP